MLRQFRLQELSEKRSSFSLFVSIAHTYTFPPMSTKVSSPTPKEQERDENVEYNAKDQGIARSGSGKQDNEPTSSEADRSHQSEAESNKTGEDQEVEPSSAQDNGQATAATAENAWTTAWDEASQAYYWWNMVTYETTWDNPYEKKATASTTTSAEGGSPQTSAAAAAAASPAESQTSETSPRQASVYAHTSQYPYQFGANGEPYVFQAYFNTRTGKFQTANEVDRFNPERLSIENRAKRQMQYYFDVDAYMEERNREKQSGMAGQKRRLTKKDIERFKQAKQEKKMRRAREWLCD